MKDPFRALRPIDSRQADSLDHAWLTGDAEERHELDIVAELMRRRAQRGRDPLLDPPADNEADAQIRLGRVLHGDRELDSLGVATGELCQHMGIFGRSGSGKSTLALRIMRRLCELRIPWVCLDHKRSARALTGLRLPHTIHVLSLGRDIGATLHANPLYPPRGVPLDTHLRQVVEILCQIWFAGEGVRALLIKAIEACAQHGVPTFIGVREHVERLAVTQREILWRQSACRILEAVTTGQLGRVLNRRTDTTAFDRLLAEHTIIELDGLSMNDAVFVTSTLIRYLTTSMMAGRTREQLRFVFLVEEAHHLLGKHHAVRESVLETALRESREFGCGFIIVDQTIGAVSPVALANLFTTVVFNCKHRSDLTAASSALLLDDDQRDLLGTLPVGECVVRLADRWPRAVHLRVPLLDLPKGSVTDREIHTRFLVGPYCRVSLDGDSADPSDSKANRPRESNPGAVTAIPPPDRRAYEGHSRHDQTGSHTVDRDTELPDVDASIRAYVEHVAQEPLLSVTQRYQALGVSRRKGDAIKRHLMEARLITPIDIPTPKGKTVLTQLTETALTWCRRHRIAVTPTNGGLAHAWWQAHLAERLRAHGWMCELEHAILGHAFDIHATSGKTTLLAEIETGLSAWLQNLAMLETVEASVKAVLWVGDRSILKARLHVSSRVDLLLPTDLQRWVIQVSHVDSSRPANRPTLRP